MWHLEPYLALAWRVRFVILALQPVPATLLLLPPFAATYVVHALAVLILVMRTSCVCIVVDCRQIIDLGCL